MKVERTIQVTLNQNEIDTLENMQTLLEDLYFAMEDASLTEITTIVDNEHSIRNKEEIEQMLDFVKSFY